MMEIDGVKNAVLVMGTELNKSVLQEFGGLTDEAKAASANDLVVSLDVTGETAVAASLKRLNELVSGQGKENTKEEEIAYPSLKKAAEVLSDANLAFISVPGDYAAAEADEALDRGMNVFIFSDNVPLEEEVALKQKARKRDFSLWGPACGVKYNQYFPSPLRKVREAISYRRGQRSRIHEIAKRSTRWGKWHLTGQSPAVETLSDAVVRHHNDSGHPLSGSGPNTR
jgi:hypothetical protein